MWVGLKATGSGGAPIAHALLGADELARIQKGGAATLLPLAAGGCDADDPAASVFPEADACILSAAAALGDQIPAYSFHMSSAQ